MAKRRSPGLVKRGETWHIDKRASWLPGGRLRESCETTSLEEAERFLTYRLEELRQQIIYGVRRERTFEEAATRYLKENAHLRTVLEIARILERIMPHIGHLPLRSIHRGTLDDWIAHCRAQGMKAKTINNHMAIIRRVLNLSARLYRDEQGRPYLDTAPLLPDEPVTDEAKPYPLDWHEQRELFGRLPTANALAALYAVNTGCREQEVCGLRWEWERHVNGRSVFMLPASATKSGVERVVVLNSIAQSVIDSVRGDHSEWVFVSNGRRLPKIYGWTWRRAWRLAGLPTGPNVKKGVHNLRHTVGRRLRAAGVALETRRVILGHATGDLTTHYSAAEIEELQRAVDQLVEQRPGTVLRAVG